MPSQDDRPMSVRIYGPCKGIVRRPCGLLKTITRVYDYFSKIVPCPHDHRAVLYGDRTMLIRCVYRLRAYNFFQIFHCAELNKIVEATVPIKQYDDRKFSLWRQHGNGDFDIVRASYTRRKANVTEELVVHISSQDYDFGLVSYRNTFDLVVK